MKRVTLLGLLALLTFTTKTFSQSKPDSYLEKAIAIMEQNSVNKKKIDWAKIRTEAKLENNKSNSIQDTYPIIKNILNELGDQHSGFYEPQVVEFYLKRYKDSGLPFPYAKDSIINDKYAYITIPAIGNLNQEDWEEYVSSFYKKIKKLEKINPKAWIIDVRENDGGMFSPMFKSIYPFLDAVNVVGSIDNSGEIGYYSNTNSNINFNKTVIATFQTPDIKIKKKNRPIYILTSKKTASSGEFIVASFKGQKNVKIIGCNTQGLTSDNSEFRLIDNAILKITTGILMDRNKTEYREIGKGIAPDIQVETTGLKNYIEKITK
ncbi:S41 family peptidase [Flavobacterium sp. FlaQc-50]|uniref:S41 family peptidase n=1 Tax=unclassified Flavobacterium TaxID=196869 RepID=UPI003756F38D